MLDRKKMCLRYLAWHCDQKQNGILYKTSLLKENEMTWESTNTGDNTSTDLHDHTRLGLREEARGQSLPKKVKLLHFTIGVIFLWITDSFTFEWQCESATRRSWEASGS